MAFKPEYPRAMSTLVTILDRYDPVLFALVYEEIEAKVQRDCRGRFQEKKLDSLLTWLNGSGVGAGTSGGVMGWVSGLYANSEKRGSGDEARKFLKPTFSRFEYHIHKILCQLR
jgi:anaphase-promoting complex subunit 2